MEVYPPALVMSTTHSLHHDLYKRVRGVQVMGIPVLSVPGVEADDVIGTLAVRAVNEGMQAAIVSSDKVCVYVAAA